MAIKKIIYVTEGQHEEIPDIDPTAHGRLGDLSKTTKGQLDRVLQEVLIPEIGDAKAIFKSSGYSDPSWEVLGHLSYGLHKPNTPHIERDIFGKSEAWEIDEISKLKGDEDIVIFGSMHQDFEKLIDSLKSNGYNVIDKEAIMDRGNTYTLTVYLDGKKNTDFHKFGDEKE